MANFHLELIRQIFKKYHEHNFIQNILRSDDKNPLRLTGRHFSAIYIDAKIKRKSALRKCIVCTKNDV